MLEVHHLTRELESHLAGAATAQRQVPRREDHALRHPHLLPARLQARAWSCDCNGKTGREAVCAGGRLGGQEIGAGVPEGGGSVCVLGGFWAVQLETTTASDWMMDNEQVLHSTVPPNIPELIVRPAHQSAYLTNNLPLSTEA